MPTFSAIVLDRLIEPGASKSSVSLNNNLNHKSGNSVNQNSKLEKRNSTPALNDKKFQWANITPALYATPAATPLPDSPMLDSPSSFPPSPYIVNHKRRGPRLSKSFSQLPSQRREKEEENGHEQMGDSGVNIEIPIPVSRSYEEKHINGFLDDAVDDVKVVGVDGDLGEENEDEEEIGSNGFGNGLVEESGFMHGVAMNSERDGDVDDFFDPQDSMSYTSNTEGDEFVAAERSFRLSTPVGEYFDAWEELSTESGRQAPPVCDVEGELREIRLSLLLEIEKRKQAEESLSIMRKEWQRIREQLAHVGLTLPADPIFSSGEEQEDSDPVEELCQQVDMARFVSNSIGRGSAKAEVETEMEAQMEAKNFEIARLWDRLHYYEAVNREMSQRNQEAVELARRQRQERKRGQRWVWGSVVTAITLGTAALVWSYLPSSRGSVSTDGPETSDHGQDGKS
ncbi:hypothetical protein RJ641_010588 [Dillenia turbinata]|uniref:Uncharacterized protein n=1 Tax=Dillenia turbinata TaxID=194707 RepID=A0AAN8VAV6_9MAGN